MNSQVSTCSLKSSVSRACTPLFVGWELYIWRRKKNLSDNYCQIPAGICDYQDGHLSLNFVLGWRVTACKVDHYLCSQGTALPKRWAAAFCSKTPFMERAWHFPPGSEGLEWSYCVPHSMAGSNMGFNIRFKFLVIMNGMHEYIYKIV